MHESEGLVERFEAFDWSGIFYDPMDVFNIDHDEDAKVLFKLNHLYRTFNVSVEAVVPPYPMSSGCVKNIGPDIRWNNISLKTAE